MTILKEQFICQREGLTIKGMQFLPKAPASDKLPAIIISHGFTDNYFSMLPYCEDFAKEGYAAFCFNFCGGGSTEQDPATRSDGDSRDMTISTEVQDLKTVIAYVKSLPFVDVTDIILMGESQGGFVSGITAAECSDEISKLIMVYPALCIPDHARRGCLGGARYDISSVPEELVCERTIISRKFHEDVCQMDPYLKLAAYKGPVQILHGYEDSLVDYSYSVRAQSCYESGQCHLQLIREMGHGHNEEQRSSITASVRQFLHNRQEIMSFRILITHTEEWTEGTATRLNIYFTGYCESAGFKGTIIPEGIDRQTYVNDVRTAMKAEYTLEGLDENRKLCRLHVINEWGGTDFKPVIQTDSKKLGWLNKADLTAVLEGAADGPTVRIFAKR